MNISGLIIKRYVLQTCYFWKCWFLILNCGSWISDHSCNLYCEERVKGMWGGGRGGDVVLMRSAVGFFFFKAFILSYPPAPRTAHEYKWALDGLASLLFVCSSRNSARLGPSTCSFFKGARTCKIRSTENLQTATDTLPHFLPFEIQLSSWTWRLMNKLCWSDF